MGAWDIVGYPIMILSRGRDEIGMYGISYPFQHNATQRDKILTLDKHWQST